MSDAIQVEHGLHHTELDTPHHEIQAHEATIAYHQGPPKPKDQPPLPDGRVPPPPASKHEKTEKIPDSERYAGGGKDLNHFVIQLRIKLEGNADRFGTLRAATMYGISHLEAAALAQGSVKIPDPKASS